MQNKMTKKKYNVKFLQYLKKQKKPEVNVEIITFYILREHKNAAGSALAGGNVWSNIFVIKGKIRGSNNSLI